jgi:hypothetical protein
VWMDFYNKSFLGYGVQSINDLHTLILNWMASIEGLSWGFCFVFIIFIGTYTKVCVDVLIQSTQMGAFNLIYVEVVQYLKCTLYLEIFFIQGKLLRKFFWYDDWMIVKI